MIYVILRYYVAGFFLELEIFYEIFVVNIKTHILCSVTSSEYRDFSDIMWKNMLQPDRPQMTI
jgi:hypothetical protein